MAEKNPNVILTGFMDEGTRHRNKKDILEQMGLLLALGLSYYTPRAMSINGRDEKNVGDLTEGEVDTLIDIHNEYGAKVSSLGLGIGKTRLTNLDDGSDNKFEPKRKTLARMDKAISIADRLGTKLLRCFSFYPPKGSNLAHYVNASVDKLGPLIDVCEKAGAIYGLEVESNLTCHNAETCMAIYNKINKPKSLALIYDGANLVVQHKDIDAVAEFVAMVDGLKWMHIKDYKKGASVCEGGHVPEDLLKNFVPAGELGRVNHLEVFKELRKRLPGYISQLNELGVPGFFMDLEPHLKGGGQFGGYSGPDGMFVALEALKGVLYQAKIAYQVRSFNTLVGK